MNEPAVTFIIAARDAGETVGAAVESAISQNYGGAISVIAVDDGSRDNTVGVLRRYDGVTVLSYTKSRGRAAARNSALDLVRSEFVAIQDADDVSLPDRIRVSMQLLQGADATAVGTQLSWIDPRVGPYRGGAWPTNAQAAGELLSKGRMPIAHPSMLARADALIDVGGYSDKYPVGEDLDLLLRIRRRKPEARFLSVDSAELLYRRSKLASFAYAFESTFWRNVVLADNGLSVEGGRRRNAYVEAMSQWARQRAKALLRRN